MVTVELITIGNEILLGLVQDTNSSYLCRVVREMGGRVRRITTLRDEVHQVAAEVSASLERGPSLIITCGGLGPTEDDLTLAAVALATGKQIALNPEAKEFVERKYRDLAAAGYVAKAELDEARLKMARLPEGSNIIENPVGAAPAVWLKCQASRILCLPGVPGELKAIVEGSLQPLLNDIFGSASYREAEVLVECGDESRLAPLLRRVASAHPDVYIKSRASRFGPDVKFRILFSATADHADAAKTKIEDAMNELSDVLKDSGIRTAPLPKPEGK